MKIDWKNTDCTKLRKFRQRQLRDNGTGISGHGRTGGLLEFQPWVVCDNFVQLCRRKAGVYHPSSPCSVEDCSKQHDVRMGQKHRARQTKHHHLRARLGGVSRGDTENTSYQYWNHDLSVYFIIVFVLESRFQCFIRNTTHTSEIAEIIWFIRNSTYTSEITEIMISVISRTGIGI